MQQESGTVTADVADTQKDTVEFTSTTAPQPNDGSDKGETPKPEPAKDKAPLADTPDGTEPQPEKPLNPRTIQRKAEKERLIREAAEKGERVKLLEAELSKYTKPDAKAAKSEDSEPSEVDYENVLDYLKAHQKWTAKQEVKTFEQKQQEQAKQQQAEREYQVKQTDYNKRIEPLLQTTPDLITRAQSFYEAGLVTPQLEAAVLDSPVGELITLHLVNNPQDLQILRNMNEAQTYKAIGMLEAALSNRQGSSSQAPGRQTQATPPINPVRGQASTTKSLSNMTGEEIEAMPQREFEAKYFKKKR